MDAVIARHRGDGAVFRAVLAAIVQFGLMTGMIIAMTPAQTSATSDCDPLHRDCGAPLPALRATLYYTALEADYARGTDAMFLDRLGRILRRGSSEFVAAAAIEGSVRFDDGEVLNYDRRIGAEVRWLRTESELGLDALGCELVPYRSAAVDPELISSGTLLFLEETHGMPLPDGSLHDGIWLASDIGEAIKGDRIDLYTGLGMASMQVPRTFGIGHLQPLSARSLGFAQGCESGRFLTKLPSPVSTSSTAQLAIVPKSQIAEQ
jgi:3D (Asp-Asp-Asp) domain-containing protein